MERAMRSLTLPPGFRCSHLTSTGTGRSIPPATRRSATSGGPPMRARMDGPDTIRPSVEPDHVDIVVVEGLDRWEPAAHVDVADVADRQREPSLAIDGEVVGA